MSNTRTCYLLTALALLLATSEPSSASFRIKLNNTTPSLGSASDYWSASRASLREAGERRRLNETQAACEALAQSLDYYRMALDKELLGSVAKRARSDEGDAMQEIRTRFGCTKAQLG